MIPISRNESFWHGVGVEIQLFWSRALFVTPKICFVSGACPCLFATQNHSCFTVSKYGRFDSDLIPVFLIQYRQIPSDTVKYRWILPSNTVKYRQIPSNPAGAKRPQRAKRAPAERSEAFQYLQLGTRHAKNYK